MSFTTPWTKAGTVILMVKNGDHSAVSLKLKWSMPKASQGYLTNTWDIG